MGTNDTEILFEKQDGIGLVTFNRPEVLNAFRNSTFDRLSDILTEIENDGDIRAVVLTGTGRAFCAGEDLKEMAQELTEEASAAHTIVQLGVLQDLTRRTYTGDTVFVAAVNGLAVGLGAELSLACDIRIAASDAGFMFPEAKRAMIHTNGTYHLLPRLIGGSRAAEWLLSARLIPAEEALAAGLVSRMVPSDAVLETALDTARTIAGHAPIAIRLIRDGLRRSHALDLEESLRIETEGIKECLASDDLREGVLAFTQKRAPRYKGR